MRAGRLTCGGRIIRLFLQLFLAVVVVDVDGPLGPHISISKQIQSLNDKEDDQGAALHGIRELDSAKLDALDAMLPSVW